MGLKVTSKEKITYREMGYMYNIVFQVLSGFYAPNFTQVPFQLLKQIRDSNHIHSLTGFQQSRCLANDHL